MKEVWSRMYHKSGTASKTKCDGLLCRRGRMRECLRYEQRTALAVSQEDGTIGCIRRSTQTVFM
jgi:hypothetical protein